METSDAMIDVRRDPGRGGAEHYLSQHHALSNGSAKGLVCSGTDHNIAS
jgi:hypothetical protein